MESLQSTSPGRNIPPGLTDERIESSRKKPKKTPDQNLDVKPEITEETPELKATSTENAQEIIRIFRDSTLQRGYRAFSRWLEQNADNTEASFPQSFNLFVAEFEHSENLKKTPEFHDLIVKMNEWKAKMTIRKVEIAEERAEAAREQARQERLAEEAEARETKFDDVLNDLRTVDTGQGTILPLVEKIMGMFEAHDIATIRQIQERIALQAVKEDEHNKNRPWYRKLTFTGKKHESNNLFRLWGEAMDLVNEKMKEKPKRPSKKK
jgi:hypothetical protein